MRPQQNSDAEPLDCWDEALKRLVESYAVVRLVADHGAESPYADDWANVRG